MLDNYFLKESTFASGKLFTGFLPDIPDSRDYKFSDLMKKQGTLKVKKEKVKRSIPLKRGCYRKSNYSVGKEFVTISKDVTTKLLASISPCKVDHSVNMSPVKDQGQFGACVAFSGAAMKEFQEKIEHEKEVTAGKKYDNINKIYDYSEQWLYWNCKKIDGIPNVQGTYIRTVFKVLNKIGVPIESAWPYSDSNINIGKPKRWANLIARWAVVGSYWRVNNLIELKAALIDGPVVVGVPVFEEWRNPSDGYIKYPSKNNTLGGHAICVVGYNNETEHIKFKNSWSTRWGDKGYGYLSYKYINDFFWGGWVAKDISVTRDMLKGTRTLI